MVAQLPFELVSGKYSEDCMVIVAVGDLGSTLWYFMVLGEL